MDRCYLDVPGRNLGSMVRINGLFHLLINGGLIVSDPNLLPHFQRDIQVGVFIWDYPGVTKSDSY